MRSTVEHLSGVFDTIDTADYTRQHGRSPPDGDLRLLEFCYWRGRGEIDFVAQTPRRIVPIQVSWEPATPRHHRALEEFYETFPQADEALFVGPEEYEAGVLGRLTDT